MIENPPSTSDFHPLDVFHLLGILRTSGEINDIQDDYLYWDKIKYKFVKYGNEHKVWAAIKLHREGISKNIVFGNYKFSYPITDYMQRMLHFLDLNVGGSLTSNIGIPETDKNKYIINSLIEESISSSQIEGANTTRKKAKEMIRNERKPITKSELMIINNFITMNHIVQIKGEELTIEKLSEIHQLISKDTLNNKNYEGKFRTDDDIFVENTIKGEIVYTPPSHTELDNLIKDVIDFFNNDTKKIIHPVIKACIIHFMIGWIHPFVDGNGRTARAIFYWYMLKKGYWTTEFLSISKIIKNSKISYEKAFLYAETDNNDLGYFITYKIKAMVKAYDELRKYINKKQREVIQTSKFMAIAGVNNRMAQIIKLIYDNPDRVLSGTWVARYFAVSDFTARTDLKSLVRLGFLDLIKVNLKQINYIKSKEFDKNIAKII